MFKSDNDKEINAVAEQLYKVLTDKVGQGKITAQQVGLITAGLAGLATARSGSSLEEAVLVLRNAHSEEVAARNVDPRRLN